MPNHCDLKVIGDSKGVAVCAYCGGPHAARLNQNTLARDAKGGCTTQITAHEGDEQRGDREVTFVKCRHCGRQGGYVHRWFENEMHSAEEIVACKDRNRFHNDGKYGLSPADLEAVHIWNEQQALVNECARLQEQVELLLASQLGAMSATKGRL